MKLRSYGFGVFYERKKRGWEGEEIVNGLYNGQMDKTDIRLGEESPCERGEWSTNEFLVVTLSGVVEKWYR